MFMAAKKPVRAGAPQKNKSKVREILTPEGVPLSVTLAGRGERLTAFLLDLFFIFLALLLLGFVTLLIVQAVGLDTSIILVMLAYFILRSFYFALFELYWQGQTPGKRLMKLQVIRRSGGRLDAGAIFSRNLLREVEFFLPLTVLFYGNSIGADKLMVLLTLAWTFIMLFMPFFNKDNMRVGDIVGGTWVIANPKVLLLPEVGRHAAPAADRPQVFFTKEQLGIYGIYELETLENVLRRTGIEADKLQQEVVDRIKAKIKWRGGAEHLPDREFLQAFYSALRQHLESGMLMGRRKEDKFDGVAAKQDAAEGAGDAPRSAASPPPTEPPLANPLRDLQKESSTEPMKNPLYKGPENK